MNNKINKGKILEKILAIILCVIFIFQTAIISNASTVEHKKDTNQIKDQSTIEEIIEECEDGKSNAQSMTDSELDEFFDTNYENALLYKSEEEIEAYFSTVICGSASRNTSGGIITSPVTYLHNTVGKTSDTYTVTKTKSVSGIGNKTCSDLGGHSNCTLTALYNIMVYYRAKGYSKIPSTQNGLYSVIKKQATALGYDYDNSTGLSVTKNNNLVTNTWQKGFGYSSGKGTSNYLWTATTVTDLIDAGKPCMFSLASGAYYNHTITIYGYKVYKNNRTGKKYTFLMIKDGWSNTTRYLAWTNTNESYVACLTTVTAP